MSNNLVIVALPAQDDPVWKISSEKVPHLTLLFMGDESTADLEGIMEFVQHAVSISERGPFYCEVDYRGTLGPDEADVLFFRKNGWSIPWVKQFRAQLLQNDAIRNAYDSVDQYPEWTPHLTLGYPATPAHPLPDDRLPYSVTFDRIAVWTGDYSGPDFRLEWTDRECSDGAIAYSSMNQERARMGLEAIEHHGVKGMKWGINKANKTVSVSTGNGNTKLVTPKKAIKLDAKWTKNQYTLPKGIERYNAQADHFNSRIGAVNDKYKHDDFSKEHHDEPAKWTPRYKQYNKDITALQEASFRHAVDAVHGTSPTGKLKAVVEGDIHKDTLRMVVKNVSDVTHTAVGPNDEVFMYTITRNAQGHITKIAVLPDTTLAQTSNLGLDFIEHHGIKGMRWGIRNRKGIPTAIHPVASSRVPSGTRRKTKIDVQGGQNHPAHPDAIKVAESKAKLKKSGPSALSNTELRDVANRVQLENQVATLTSRKGRQFVTRQLQNETSNLARQGVREGVKKGVKRAGQGAAIAAL